MSRAVAFAGNPLDRASLERRDRDWLDAQLRSDDSRFLALWRLDPLVKAGSERVLAWARAEMFDGLEFEPDRILLGVANGISHFAVDVSEVGDSAEARLGVEGAARFEDLRAVAPSLGPGETGIAAQARSLIDWHANNAWCAACGGGTRMRHGGGARVCGDCLVEHFPRTNPVAIAVVVDGDRCLLGRAKGWPAGLYSALAGFIEAGETIEEALRREVLEESGVSVGAVKYVKSQPWPFPASLMIGCIAEAESTAIQIDPLELEDADWFDRDLVLSALAGRSSKLFVPPAMAIAHHLIDAWANDRKG